MSGRYEALYIGGICDGYWDNKTKQYLDDDTIIKLLNKEDYDSVWEERCQRLKEQNRQLQTKLRMCRYGREKKKGQKVSYKSVYRF